MSFHKAQDLLKLAELAASRHSGISLPDSPGAAATAREFMFHPDQIITDHADGGLIVTFRASGWVEMAWHLYQWGDTVEVIEPPELREMVAAWQGGAIGVLP